MLNVDYGDDDDFSPKKYRRDGKQDRERERERLTTNDREPTKKSNSIDQSEPSKHSSQPPRSRSYYQVIPNLFYS